MNNKKPHYIREQHNHQCQQFFGPVTNCVFNMPPAEATTTKPSEATTKPAEATTTKPSEATTTAAASSRRTPTLSRLKASDVKAVKAAAQGRELMTFRAPGVLAANLTLLYQQMVKDGWIDGRTLPDDFLALFSGERSECKVIWSGKYGKGTLVFLFQYLEMEQCITIDRGFTIPNILMGHFVDAQGLYLTRLDKGDAPNAKAGTEVQSYVKILKYNPAKAITGSGSDYEDSYGMSHDDYEDNHHNGYDDGYDPYDHQDLRLHRR